ncbi:GGDEF domain-containing protein, partial [Candidatus Woesearchaeota archaeon]|nr:GGDEF domain-containing protein [Candidatus Woesearchaeota archaeon]
MSWFKSKSAKSFEILSELCGAPIYIFENEKCVEVFGKVPYFQQVLDKKNLPVSIDGNSVKVCSFAVSKQGKYVFVMGPFRSGTGYNDEELSDAFEGLPVFSQKHQPLLDFAAKSAKLSADREIEDSKLLRTQSLLLDFLHAVANVRDLNTLLKRAAEFFVHKFHLSNAVVSAFGLKYRHFNSNSVYDDVEQIIAKQLADSRTSFRISGIVDDIYFRHLENLGSIPSSFVAYPLLLDRHIFGSIVLYCDKLPYLEDFPDLLKELESLLVQVSDYERVKTSARVDPLTGLNNRLHFVSAFDTMLSSLAKDNKPISVLMYDVDNFKKFNDTKGHPEGDRVLVAIADVTKKLLPSSALACRYGGEEFVIVLPELCQNKAADFAESLRASVEKETDLTISVGLITCLNSSASRIELIK